MFDKKIPVKKIIFFSVFLTALIGWTIALALVGPEDMVQYIGVENGYALGFLFAAIGGMSTLSSTSYFATIITLAAGGLNPYLLAAVAGVGLLIGDSLFYYFGKTGRDVLSAWMSKRLDKFADWLSRRPNWLIPIIVYVYIGFTPLPNDILMVGLAVGGYEYKKIVIPLFLGNITIVLLMSFLAQHGIRWFGW